MKMKNYLNIIPDDVSCYIWKLYYNNVLKEIRNFNKEIKEIHKIIYTDKYKKLHVDMKDEKPIVWPIIKNIIDNKIKLYQILNNNDYYYFKTSYISHIIENKKIFKKLSLEDSFIATMMMIVWH